MTERVARVRISGASKISYLIATDRKLSEVHILLEFCENCSERFRGLSTLRLRLVIKNESHATHESYRVLPRQINQAAPNNFARRRCTSCLDRHPYFHTPGSGLRIEIFVVTLEEARRVGCDFVARVREPLSPNRIYRVPEP